MDLKNPPSISHSIYYLSKAIVGKKEKNQILLHRFLQ